MSHLDRALVKQPAESRVYEIDFTNLLAAGDTISGAPTVAAAPAGLTISGIAAASFRNSGGADGTRYRVTAVVATANGDTIEGEGDLDVRDL